MDTEKKSNLKIFKEVFYKNLRLFHILFFAIFFLIILSTTTNVPCDYRESDLYIGELIGQVTQLEEDIANLKEQIDSLEPYNPLGEQFNFDSGVMGYFKTITEPIATYDEKPSIGTFEGAYFVITGYEEKEEMENFLKAFEKDNVNKVDDDITLFSLGCYEKNSIKRDGGDQETEYIDSVTMSKILNSTKEKPINLRLFFQNSAGAGCECCGLAYKIRAE